MKTIPTYSSETGRLAFLMMDGVPRTRLDITREMGAHDAREVTARVRDLRKIGFTVSCSHERRDDKTLYFYTMELSSQDHLMMRVYHCIARAEHSIPISAIALQVNERLRPIIEAVERLENFGRISQDENFNWSVK